MLVNIPEMLAPKPKAPEASHTTPFEALGFRQKRMNDHGETYYRAEMSDGQIHFLQVKTALEALHQATKLGNVLKVERSGLARLRMLDRGTLVEDEGDNGGPGLIKPGTVLITLATMAKLQAANNDDVPAAAEISAPALAAMEAEAEIAPAAAAEAETHALSPDEVEKLLSQQETPPEPLG